METDSEHLGAWCACPEQGALPGWIPGIVQHRPGPAGRGGRAAVPAGATAESGKERGPSRRRRDQAGPVAPSLPGVAGDGYKAWRVPRPCITAPLRFHPGVLQPPLAAGAPELRPPATTAEPPDPARRQRRRGACREL